MTYPTGTRVTIVASVRTVDRPQGRDGTTGTVTGTRAGARFFPLWVRHDDDGTSRLYAPEALTPFNGDAPHD